MREPDPLLGGEMVQPVGIALTGGFPHFLPGGEQQQIDPGVKLSHAL